MAKLSKKDRLKDAVQTFKGSEKKAKDYFDMFMVVAAVLRQGDGLVWGEVMEVLDEVIEGKKKVPLKVVTKPVPTKFFTTEFGDIDVNEVLQLLETLEEDNTVYIYNQVIANFMVSRGMIKIDGSFSNSTVTYSKVDKVFEEMADKLRGLGYGEEVEGNGK